MKKITFLFFLILTIISFLNETVFSSNNNNINHVVIIDKTASMVGQADFESDNIWPDVKDALYNYIDDLENGDSLKVYTYSRQVENRLFLEINSSFSKIDVKDFINEIQLNGTRTCTYDALKAVFQELNQKNKLLNRIYLFTDGINSGPTYCQGSMTDAVKVFNLNKGEFGNFYYVSLDTKPPNEVRNAANQNEKIHIVKQPGEQAAFPVIITPRAQSLHFQKDKLSLNQGFRITGKSELPENFKIEIDNIHIEDLSNTTYDPSIAPNKLDPHETTPISLKFLNSPVPEGQYKGYLQFQKPKVADQFINVNPNKIDITFDNRKSPKLSIAYPSSENSVRLTKDDTLSYSYTFSFNQKAVDENLEIVFSIKANDEFISLNPEFGTYNNGKWHVNVSQLEKKMGSLSEYEVPIEVYPKKPFQETSTSLEIILAKKIKKNKEINITYQNDHNRPWTINEIILYVPTPTWVKSLIALIILVLGGAGLWFLWLREKIYPPMSGKLHFHDEPGQISLSGLKEVILYAGKKPEIANSIFLSKLFVGQVKSYNIVGSLEGTEDVYLLIRPKKRKGKIWNRMKTYNLSVNPPDSYLTHNTSYTIEISESPKNTIKTTFIYDNIDHPV